MWNFQGLCTESPKSSPLLLTHPPLRTSACIHETATGFFACKWDKFSDSSGLNNKRRGITPSVKIYYKEILNKSGREIDKPMEENKKLEYVEDIGICPTRRPKSGGKDFWVKNSGTSSYPNGKAKMRSSPQTISKTISRSKLQLDLKSKCEHFKHFRRNRRRSSLWYQGGGGFLNPEKKLEPLSQRTDPVRI